MSQDQQNKIPDIVLSLMRHLESKGMKKHEAAKVAVEHMQKSGILHPGTLILTDRGKARDRLTPEQRAGLRDRKSV